MRHFALTTALIAGLAAPMPTMAQNLNDAITGIAQTLIQQEADRAAFGQAQRSNSASAYRDYISRFPNGIHRDDASRALSAMGADVVRPRPIPAPSSPDPVVNTRGDQALEDQIGLTRTNRMQIQRDLTALGYATGGADGLWGRNTRSAIARWQADNRQTETGYVTSAQVRMISDQAERDDGATSSPTGKSAEQEERSLSLSAAERREIQLRLTILGHDTKGTNGNFGDQTRRAINAWQRDEGETGTGFITADQVRELRRATGG